MAMKIFKHPLLKIINFKVGKGQRFDKPDKNLKFQIFMKMKLFQFCSKRYTYHWWYIRYNQEIYYATLVMTLNDQIVAV